MAIAEDIGEKRPVNIATQNDKHDEPIPLYSSSEEVTRYSIFRARRALVKCLRETPDTDVALLLITRAEESGLLPANSRLARRAANGRMLSNLMTGKMPFTPTHRFESGKEEGDKPRLITLSEFETGFELCMTGFVSFIHNLEGLAERRQQNFI